MIDIVKLANGNVAIYDNSSGDFINSLSPDIVEIECNVNGSVKIVQDNGSVEYIDPATVANTQVVPAAPIAFSGTCADLALLLSTDFFFVVSGGGVSDLATVLAAGNSAGANDIDLNGNDLLNVNEITSGADLFLNPVGSIDCNGKTINMTGGELHNIPLMHSQNNINLTIEGKGTADLVFKTNNVNRLTITDAGLFTGLPVSIQLAASDETTALTAGTAKMTFRMPHAMTLTAVRASLTTAQASGSIFTVDINQGGSSVLGTKLTIDNTEKTSTTAATAATITTSALTDDSEITIDIDQIGNGTATGLKITLIGTR
jgi:hypothetical protein